MNQPIGFADAFAAAEQLDPEAQAKLVAVLSWRMAERGRVQLATRVAEARREFAAGQCQPMTAAEFVRCQRVELRPSTGVSRRITGEAPVRRLCEPPVTPVNSL